MPDEAGRWLDRRPTRTFVGGGVADWSFRAMGAGGFSVIGGESSTMLVSVAVKYHRLGWDARVFSR